MVVAKIDGRGSGFRGDYLQPPGHALYKRFGVVDVEDHIKGARFLHKLKYVDKQKTSIWGWSYGGFVTNHVLSHEEGPKLFKCGMAVAPVTDWRYYDTAYTEKYLGSLKDHLSEAYSIASSLQESKSVENFRNLTGYMLIHGTGDDNVHFQHSAQFIKRLVEAGIDFRMQIYPDQGHKLMEPAVQHHLYATMTNFLVDCHKGVTKHTFPPRIQRVEDEKKKLKKKSK